MANVARQSRLLALFVCAGALCAAPAFAQDAIEPEVEALIAPSQQTETGVALARTQIQENDLLGAVGTLERVLFVDPRRTARGSSTPA